nr:MAG TPA: hypothetical protein [Caudoviricetes sp.]
MVVQKYITVRIRSISESHRNTNRVPACQKRTTHIEKRTIPLDV